ncbi:MAG: hypothetical protein H6709_01365 [Kofleriaceae bacterium]|nr:hypothetical protein [Kofleriaceae bacterium]MCB9570718.1 hypothetical protein [Kofleriaceae bacterium]
MRSTTVAFVSALLSLHLLACVAEDDPDFVEPPLTAEELALLPDDSVVDVEHTDDVLVAGPAEDDAAAFDDDEAWPSYDVAVVDDDGDAPAAVTPIANAALLRWGLHPRASDALRAAGVAAWRITQTIGNAPASAGYHAQDGSVNGHPYSAATDLSVSGLSSTQIHNLLEKLGKLGFAAWYRKNGVDGWTGANHIHAVYANCKMKTQLRAQVRSWLVGRNGLVSNRAYTWHAFSAAAKHAVQNKFAQSHGGTSNGGAGYPGRINTSGAPLTIRAGASTSTAALGSVADGAYVTITCQKRGQSISGTYGTSTLWDHIAGGYVADAYVSTGSDGQIAPTCD